VVNYTVKLSKQALKDAEKLKQAGLFEKADKIVQAMKENPYNPPYEKLIGNYSNFYSRRINKQHRLIYRIFEERKIIHIARMWTHYE
jgi:Txe/YoeB family toxin of toxin-antitoxin system